MFRTHECSHIQVSHAHIRVSHARIYIHSCFTSTYSCFTSIYSRQFVLHVHELMFHIHERIRIRVSHACSYIHSCFTSTYTYSYSCFKCMYSHPFMFHIHVFMFYIREFTSMDTPTECGCLSHPPQDVCLCHHQPQNTQCVSLSQCVASECVCVCHTPHRIQNCVSVRMCVSVPCTTIYRTYVSECVTTELIRLSRPPQNVSPQNMSLTRRIHWMWKTRSVGDVTCSICEIDQHPNAYIYIYTITQIHTEM